MEKAEARGLSWASALLITALIVMASVIAARVVTAIGEGNTSGATLLPCSSSQKIEPLGKGVVYSDGTHLHALNSDGRQRWNYLVGAGFNFDAEGAGVAA